MRISDIDILIVPGWNNSGPDHWQTRWEAKMPTARRVQQHDWDVPVREHWVPRIIEEANKATRPLVLVGHSLGVPAVVHAAQQLSPAKVAGAFLVCPPDLDRHDIPDVIRTGFGAMPLMPLPFPAVLVGSQTDPYCSNERAQHFASFWGASFTNAGDAGHINADSGHGPWPEGLMRFAGFLKTLAPHKPS